MFDQITGHHSLVKWTQEINHHHSDWGWLSTSSSQAPRFQQPLSPWIWAPDHAMPSLAGSKEHPVQKSGSHSHPGPGNELYAGWWSRKLGEDSVLSLGPPCHYARLGLPTSRLLLRERKKLLWCLSHWVWGASLLYAAVTWAQFYVIQKPKKTKLT